MSASPIIEQQVKTHLKSIIDTAMDVITKPAQFFDSMPRSGGFLPPLLFLVVVAIVSSILQWAIGIFRFGFGGTVLLLLSSIIITPILVALFGFVGAAILFVIWKLMGSNENYETAYRCGAYAAAIMPIRAVLYWIPYMGVLIGLVWGLYLLVTASVQVHKLKAQTAWLVFGTIAIVLAIASISSERVAHRAMRTMGSWDQRTAAMVADGVTVKSSEGGGTVSVTTDDPQGTYKVNTAKERMTVTTGENGVALPEHFPGDVPVFKGAKVALSMTQGDTLLVHFEAHTSVADGLKFYQDGLKIQGWSLEHTMKMGETAMVSARKAARQCSVVIASQSGGTRIQVTVQPEG